MRFPPEYILNMGYYPDAHAAHELPVDVFFIHVTFTESFVELLKHALQSDEAWGARNEHVRIIKHYWDCLRDGVESLIVSCKEKYRLDEWNPQDAFWSVSPHPEWRPS